ncbi:MAG: DUF3102 domain-containing protein [Caldilineaceae bacterium]
MPLTAVQTKNFTPNQADTALTSTLRYDYGQIAETNRRTVQGAAVEIKAHAERAKTSMIVIGQKLMKVKELLPHGQFQEWCQLEFDMSDRMARNMMKAAEVFGSKTEIISVLSDTTMYLLAGDSVPEAAREEVIALAQTGESPKVREVKEIIEKHRPQPELAVILGHSETIDILWRAIEENTPDASWPRDRLAWLSGLEPKPESFAKYLHPNWSLDPEILAKTYNDALDILRQRAYPPEPQQPAVKRPLTLDEAIAQKRNALLVVMEPESEEGQRQRPDLILDEALTGLDYISLMLSEVGGDVANKKRLLAALYELTLESFECLDQIAHRYANNITRATLKEIIDHLKKV